MSYRVVCLGDLVADIVMEIGSLPVYPDQVVAARAASLEPGGGGNFLIAGARLGMSMVALGALGEDPLGRAVAQALQEEGVDVGRVALGPGSTTTAVVVLSDDLGRHAFIGAYGRGPEVSLTPEWEAVLRSADAVFAPGYAFLERRMGAAARECVRRVKAYGVPLFFDPGPYAHALPERDRREILACTRAVLLTEEEVRLLGFAQPEEILGHGPSLVVVKRGAQGCALWTREGRVDVPGFPVRAVDTSGAGDCFAAAFIYGYLQDRGLERAAVLANAMGAAMVQRRGTGRKAPSAADVAALLRQFRADVSL